MSRELNFKNKIVLITGGASGFGFELVKLFLSDGAKVIFTTREKTSAEKAHIIMEKFVPPQDKFYFHILLITHGRKICKAINPKCSSCPISLYCPSANL